MAAIYLDNAATTAVREEALDAMLPYLREHFANPSSAYARGQFARRALDSVRQRVASAIGARPFEVVFTAGGSEADSLAIFGIMQARVPSGAGRFVTSAVEHHAVLHAADVLRARGVEVTVLPVDANGFLQPQTLEEALRRPATLVSVMHANNEIGTLQDIRALADLAHARGALFHCDAVQTVGHIPVDVAELGVDALSFSAHKFEGPKGVGGLFVRRGVEIQPLIVGGGQESGRRSGTENLPGVAGMAAALDCAVRELSETSVRIAGLRDRLIDGALANVQGAALNGPRFSRLPNNASLRFDRVDGQAAIVSLDVFGFEASTGSACASGSLAPSHVLRAIGLSAAAAGSTVRFSLGRLTTQLDIDRLLSVLPGLVYELQHLTDFAGAASARA